MTTSEKVLRLTRNSAALAAALLSSATLAQEIANTAAYVAPDNSVNIGAGASTGDHRDRTRFGLFNGLRENDGNLLLDFNYSAKDAASGRWMIFQGRNIGLDNRELGFDYRNLGDFRLKVDYGEITRHDPRIVNTSLQGSGTTTPTIQLPPIAPGAGQELNLELKRKALGFELQKRYGNFQLEVSFKNEDKNGARLFGKGLTCRAEYAAAGVCTNTPASVSVLLFIPEPVNSTIRQFEAKLNYMGPKLKLTGGYYGNFYTNAYGSINPVLTGNVFGNMNGGANLAANAPFRTYFQGPIALWPDSQAHQFYLGGNYALTSHTKVNFKASYTRATQNENFGAMGLTGAPAGVNDLGGRLDTMRLQAGISSHPLPKLHLTGDVMYEHKDNKTRLAVYNIHHTGGTWTNSAMSPSKFEAKAQAGYKLPYRLELIGGVRYEREDFGTWTPTDAAGGINGLRQKLDIWGYRVELRKTMSETFSGSGAYVSERRDGASTWLKPLAAGINGVAPASENCVSTGTNVNDGCIYTAAGEFAFTQENMQRDKMRLNGNWAPTERLGFQALVELGTDKFRGPTNSGLESTSMYNLSLDADYKVAENWKLRAFVTANERTYNMQRTGDFELRMADNSVTAGIGFTGTPRGDFKVGGDLLLMRDVLHYVLKGQSTTAINTFAATGGLPDVKYTLARLNLYGEYVLNKASSVRLDYIYHRTFFNEWTWGLEGFPFLYSDNTTVSAKQRQSVSFIGARYVYRFK